MSGVPLLWQKVPVVVLSSWGVVSIICHRRLFLFLVNSLNSVLCDLWYNLHVGQQVVAHD